MWFHTWRRNGKFSNETRTRHYLRKLPLRHQIPTFRGNFLRSGPLCCRYSTFQTWLLKSERNHLWAKQGTKENTAAGWNRRAEDRQHFKHLSRWQNQPKCAVRATSDWTYYVRDFLRHRKRRCVRFARCATNSQTSTPCEQEKGPRALMRSTRAGASALHILTVTRSAVSVGRVHRSDHRQDPYGNSASPFSY